jgi:hypothetical protein
MMTFSQAGTTFDASDIQSPDEMMPQENYCNLSSSQLVPEPFFQGALSVSTWSDTRVKNLPPQCNQSSCSLPP